MACFCYAVFMTSSAMKKSFHWYACESNSASNCWETWKQVKGQNFEFLWHLKGRPYSSKTRAAWLRQSPAGVPFTYKHAACRVRPLILSVHDRLALLYRRAGIASLIHMVQFNPNSRSLLLLIFFLTSNANYVTSATSGLPGTFWQFGAVFLTMFLFKYWSQTFIIKVNEKINKIREYDF